MHDHLLLEGIVKKMMISIELTRVISDDHLTSSFEEIRVGSSQSQSIGIGLQITIDYIQGAVPDENLIVVSFVE